MRGRRRQSNAVDSLRRLSPVIWEPTQEDWWHAGKLNCIIGDEQGWDRAKRREFQNDVLIGHTAIRHGASVVTDNAGDFDLLARHLKLRILHVERERTKL